MVDNVHDIIPIKQSKWLEKNLGFTTLLHKKETKL